MMTRQTAEDMAARGGPDAASSTPDGRADAPSHSGADGVASNGNGDGPQGPTQTAQSHEAAKRGGAESIVAPILLVDDHPANLLALRGILEPLGQPLVEASSGEEALRRLLKEDYAVILMDVQMPGLDGFRTASIIKERPRTRHIPIIFLTALSRDAAHVFKGYAHGAVDYLLKPFDPEILRSKVTVFVDLFRKGEQVKRQEAMLRQRERVDLERKSERRYRGVIDSMPHCVWVLRPDGVLDYANEATRTLESTRQTLAIPVHPAEAEKFDESWSQANRTGRPFEGQYRLRQRDSGEYRWHLVSGVPERDDSGELAGWIVTATDFHDRKRAEDSLSEFKATLDSTYDCVLFLNQEDLTITYANEGTVRQLGFMRDELIGSSVLKIDQCCEEPAFRVRLERLRATGGGSETYSTTYARKDGTEVPMEVVLQYIVRGVTGGNFVMVARDIAERRRAEEALRATNEAKDAFLAAASHELRTPLQAAKGHAHLALMRLGDQVEQGPGKALRIIMKQIDRMAKLVEDLLDVSRLQAGRLALEVEPFDLSDLLDEVSERMQPISQGHPIEVKAPRPLSLQADRSRIEQVVVNLISNAIRYSPDGGAVTVAAKRDGDAIHVAVTDRGVGIPKDKQELIFERFGRAHGSRYGGLGLGLTISHGIVAQHGGQMWVESTGVAGEGSTFHVRLPAGTT